jgi:hypothetical protein
MVMMRVERVLEPAVEAVQNLRALGRERTKLMLMMTGQKMQQKMRR